MDSSCNDRFKMVRLHFNLTQEKFGHSIGLSKSGISTIENNIRRVTDKHIKLLCAIYNINENWLRYGREEMFHRLDDDLLEQLMRKYNLSEYSKTMLEAFLCLSDKQRVSVTEGIKAIVQGFNMLHEKGKA